MSGLSVYALENSTIYNSLGSITIKQPNNEQLAGCSELRVSNDDFLKISVNETILNGLTKGLNQLSSCSNDNATGYCTVSVAASDIKIMLYTDIYIYKNANYDQDAVEESCELNEGKFFYFRSQR